MICYAKDRSANVQEGAGAPKVHLRGPAATLAADAGTAFSPFGSWLSIETIRAENDLHTGLGFRPSARG